MRECLKGIYGMSEPGKIIYTNKNDNFNLHFWDTFMASFGLVVRNFLHWEKRYLVAHELYRQALGGYRVAGQRMELAKHGLESKTMKKIYDEYKKTEKKEAINANSMPTC
jgi:DNA modification methylase